MSDLSKNNFDKNHSNGNINYIIKNADIADKYNIISGDCSNVAKAIHEVFGGEIIAISSVPEEQFFDHLVVKIDSVIYDGRGRISWSKVENEFVSSKDWSGHEKHWFHVTDITEDSMYSEKRAKEIKRVLLDNN
jgi:hypothetical protein